jgi:D-cysteine desulfhydrase
MIDLERFPRCGLGCWPTPIQSLDRLSDLLGGPRIRIKRDDLSGLAFGGNKTRKLEFLLGDALARGCDTVLTAGAAQSNHCRQTAAAAARSGLSCHLALGGTAPEDTDGNLLLDHLLGAQVHWCGPRRKGEDLPDLAERLRMAGSRPCLIPYGGSNALGAVGFAAAMLELQRQGERPTHVVFASSSGGTQAGLLVGRVLTGLDLQVWGIRIDKDETAGQPFRSEVQELAAECGRLLGLPEHPSLGDVVLMEDWLEPGYGVVSAAEREAIALAARTEGLLLDPVYTGRAFAALLELIRRGAFERSDRVLFWHTGGTPSLFPYRSQLWPSR